MSSLLEPKETAISEWFELVKQAESSSGLIVGEELEHYLVNLLLRFMNKPELANTVLGLEYLLGEQQSGYGRWDALRKVGDECLLYSGLYRARAQKRRCRVSYYVKLGQRSYSSAAMQLRKESEFSILLDQLGSSFVRLMDVLQSIRALGGSEQQLTLIQAVDLWHDTGSEIAKKIISQHTQGFLIPGYCAANRSEK